MLRREFKFEMMKSFKTNLSFVMLSFLVFLSSCNDKSIESQQEVSFVELNMEIIENLSSSYPAKDLIMTISRNSDNSEQAVFSLVGESKKAAELGVFAARNTGNGTECSGTISCGKAIKNCLDNGQDALISNGGCATYCVTCQKAQQ